jgi:hypothetical protein
MPDQTVNPFAPPAADLDSRAAVGAIDVAGAPSQDQIAAALARLKEHVAVPDKVAADMKAAGALFRPVTLVMVALFVVSAGAAGVGIAQGGMDAGPLLILGAIFGALFLLLAGLLVGLDLAVGRRDAPLTAEVALKKYFRAIAIGRSGYAWAALAPTARLQTVTVPKLPPVATGEGAFTMHGPADVRGYAQTFARPGKGQMRTTKVNSAVVRRLDGDVAIVDAVVTFQSWPMWISIVIGVSAAIFRPGLLVGVILFFVMRKRARVAVTKTLLQGQPGVWYMFDANLLESYRATT